MKSNIWVIGLMLFIFSCQSKSDQDNRKHDMNYEYTKLYQDDIMLDSLIRKTINDGDTNAYGELFSIYSLSGHEKEFCYYAMTMAENFGHSEAYFDLYSILHYNSKRGQKTDSLANYYLLKAYESGRPNIKSEVEEIFGKDKPIPTSAEYFQELK